MKVDEKILFRLKELLEFGEQVISTKRNPPPNVIGDLRIDSQKAYQWATSTQNLLTRVFGQRVSTIRTFRNKWNITLPTPLYTTLKVF